MGSKKKTPSSPVAAADSRLLTVHQHMLRIRRTETALLSLLAQGEPWRGPLYPATGQECLTACACTLLQEHDWLSPTPREAGALLCRGLPLEEFLATYAVTTSSLAGGHTGGGRAGSVALRVLPTLGATASNLAVALGLALAMQMKKQPHVVVAFFGDGIINTGTWHEVINMLAVQKVPLVLVCNNNGMALGTPVSQSSPVNQLSERAMGYGLPAATVDGTDATAVLAQLEAAMDRARSGGGGTLLECMTPRLGGYGTLQPTEPLLGAQDCLVRLQSHLDTAGVLSGAQLKALEQQLDAEIAQAAGNVAARQAEPGQGPASHAVYAQSSAPAPQEPTWR